MDNKAMFEQVLRLEATLTGEPPYFVTSVDNPNTGGGITAGRTFDIPDKRQAVRLVVGGTHRISTPAEIEQFHALLKRQTADLAKEAMDRKQQFAMPAEMQTMLRATDEYLRQSEKREKK